MKMKNKIYLVISAILGVFLIIILILGDNGPLGQSASEETPEETYDQLLEDATKEIEAETNESKEPFLRELIENRIKDAFNEGLDFSNMNYVQWDPMDIELYHCKNTFKGKQTKKEHDYLARVGFDRDGNLATMYYLKIDGETVYWDEDGETSYIDNN